MMKKSLKNVTLLGLDCVDIDRLILTSEICQEQFDFAEVKLLTSLSSKNKNAVSIEPITTIEEYSRFMIKDLDSYVNTTHVLLFQYDGFILNPSAWTDEFLNYDYIGAPWLVRKVSVNRFGFPEELLGQRVVGNGGFSLRSKKLLSICSNLAQNNAFKKYHPEDVVLSVLNRKLLEDNGIRFAPIKLAEQFSYEAIDDTHKMWDGQFGFHGIRWTDISKWSIEHPEYEINVKNNTIKTAK